jgi:hypothetical protein
VFEAVVDVGLSGIFLAWFIVEVLVIWSERAVVVFDPYQGRWRAQRRMDSSSILRRCPPAGPPSEDSTTGCRLCLVDEIAS